RVAAQQRSALDDVIIRALADHDGTQAQAVAATLDENASQQAADAAKAVEHYVLWFCVGCASLANLLAQFFGEECVQISGSGFLELLVHATEVNGNRANIQGLDGIQDGLGVIQVKFFAIDAAHHAVGLDDVNGGLVDQL